MAVEWLELNTESGHMSQSVVSSEMLVMQAGSIPPLHTSAFMLTYNAHVNTDYIKLFKPSNVTAVGQHTLVNHRV